MTEEQFAVENILKWLEGLQERALKTKNSNDVNFLLGYISSMSFILPSVHILGKKFFDNSPTPASSESGE